MKHPCFDKDAHGRFGRVHLPVAPACNIRCGYCDRRFSCVNESRPGVSARILSPENALNAAREAIKRDPRLSVAGIAGPGDPLANPEETLATLRLLRAALPEIILCLSTNGLALPEYANNLARLGVSHLTITVNAVDPEIGGRIYRKAAWKGEWLYGRDAASLLLERQLAGIRLAKEAGIIVKINMVIIPGVNDSHAAAVAEKMAALGADLMNCIPLLPTPETPLGGRGEPNPALMKSLRAEAERFLPQMRHCGRCRADACGLLGEKTTLMNLNGG